ncbi:MAG: beta-glucosidase [Ignisphaera sp.]
MSLDNIVQELTVEEKIALLVGTGTSKTVPGAAGETRTVQRLAIPSIILSDGPAGVRIYTAKLGDKNVYTTTAFPNAILLASTWNIELVEKVGKAIGEEAKEYGVDVMLAPGLNIHRVPLCGRNFEYFSEDPLLTGEIAAAYVRGVQSVGVGATLKHFVANDQETNRFTIDVIVSERALREIYLRAFEIAIEKSKPWAIMAAYNKLNGKYCTQNPWLLTKVLKEEWRYDGLVMTDWWAGDDPVEQIKAGTDLIMPGDDNIVKRLLEAYKQGLLNEKTINDRVSRVLNLVIKSLKYQGYKPTFKPDLEKHSEIAYEAAVEGFVLLKNDDVLPIHSSARVAVFGKGSYFTVKGGLGSGNTYPKHVISIIEGLKERGVKIDEELDNIYRKVLPSFWGNIDFINSIRRSRIDVIREANALGISWLLIDFTEHMLEYLSIINIPENIFDHKVLENIAYRNDIALITISRISGEGFDRLPLKGDFYLRDDEFDLIKKVSEVFHKLNKKVVVILNVPSPVEIDSWRNLVDAILVIWLPGQEAGRAVADVILGKVSPSGRLPLSWPKDLYETPAMKSFPGEPRDNPAKVIYGEDIYVGYRYYDTFNVEPAYEFGYGLSYTEFEYKDLEIIREDNVIKVKLRVRNIGRYPGKEVVQIYVKPPRSKIDKPFQELKGFQKTKLLCIGCEEEVEIVIPINYLASFAENKWIVEKGVYEVRIGSSSRKIKLTSYIELESDVCFNTSWKRIQCN